VRLIDHEARDLHATDRGQKKARAEPLGRDVQELNLPVAHVIENRALLLLTLQAVERSATDLVERGAFVEPDNLIAHQGDQGRDDKRDAIAQSGGKLEAERLARARGHHDQHILAIESEAHGFFLQRPEAVEAIHLAQPTQKLVRFRRFGFRFRRGFDGVRSWRDRWGFLGGGRRVHSA
jgi:hypothetical protein